MKKLKSDNMTTKAAFLSMAADSRLANQFFAVQFTNSGEHVIQESNYATKDAAALNAQAWGDNSYIYIPNDGFYYLDGQKMERL